MAEAHNAVAQAFSQLVNPEVEDEKIDLVAAALAIAKNEYPELDHAVYARRIDELAERVRERAGGSGDTSEIIVALNAVLFDEEGFAGNTSDYYDPRNSFLNDVLERKLGIPITLSLVYMEVARRVGLPLFGVGMPGHFLLKHYEADGREVLIDAFHRGSVLTAKDCQQRLDQIYAGQLPLQPDFLVPVSRRQMLTRMLNNLRSIYMAARNVRKALPVVDMILAIYPRSPEDVRQRALLRYQIGQLRGAVQDLDDYLKMAPEASDADEVRETALAIRRSIAQMN
jgi:regulator of sirC expression with transglutaminase-like and TPR domain